MDATTRLLLPFTEEIDPLALDYAVQIAKQHQATLVLLALIPVRSQRNVRMELIQQAQDFLVLTNRKASRQGVPIEMTQLYTRDAVRSIEAFASEMHCEAVLLFLYNTCEVLLGYAESSALVDHGVCNVHVIILPQKRARMAVNLSPGRAIVQIPGRLLTFPARPARAL
ncbi:MAG: universal stress protein [Ktedonobacteraceae bacterium]